MTKDESVLVKKLMQLRHDADRARARLMLALHEVEQAQGEKVLAWGYASFDAFVKAHDFCRPDAYRDFVAGMEAIGSAEVAGEIGVNATSLAMRVPEKRRAEYVKGMLQSVKESGKQPSEGAARNAATKCGMPTILRSVARAGELEQLRAENAVLKAENRRLTRELEKLRSKRKAA